jgi:hypothetical protein
MEKCCERDHNNDGNCDRHPKPHPTPAEKLAEALEWLCVNVLALSRADNGRSVGWLVDEWADLNNALISAEKTLAAFKGGA